MQRLDSLPQNHQRHAADCVLVDQLLRSDPDAWAAFVHQFGRVIRSRVGDVATSFGRGTDSGAIDDGVAEVFAALLNNDAAALRAFAGRSSLVTYLAVIATRSATRSFALAARGVSAQQSCTLATNEVADPTVDTPIGRVIRDESGQRVQSLLAQLPEKQREVIRLFHLESQSYSAISQHLKIPIGSIGPTLRRGEAKLKEWLESQS